MLQTMNVDVVMHKLVSQPANHGETYSHTVSFFFFCFFFSMAELCSSDFMWNDDVYAVRSGICSSRCGVQWHG